MSFKNVRLRTKIMVGIGVPLVLALILGIISIWNINLMTETEKWVEHTYKVIGEAEKIIAHAVDMETGMRGYLLAGKDEFLEPYQQGEQATYDAIKSLQQTVDDNPAQVERLGEVEQILREWQEQVTEPSIALRREIGHAETMNDMADLVKEARGKVYFDTFRGQIATFIAREEELMVERQQAAEKATAKNEANAQLITETTAWVDHTFRVMATANEILAAAVDMETGMRGFLLAGNEEFLEPYNAGNEKFAELVASLSKTVDDNPAQAELLGDIAATIAEWQEQVVTPMIELRRQIGDAKTMDDMADLVGEARGKQYFDQFRGIMADFVGEEVGLLEQRQDTNANTVKTTITSIIAGVIAALIIGVLVGLVITRDVQRQVGGEPAVIAGIAREVAEGNLRVALDTRKPTGILAALVEMVRVLNTIVTDIKKVADNVAAGRIDARGNASAFAGGWRDLVSGMNDVVDAFVGPINVTAEYLDRIAKGDVPDKITEDYKGDFNEIKNNLNMLIDNISNVLQETNGLILAVQDGKLDIRGNAEVYNGNWRELVMGINQVLDAFVKPLTMAAESLDHIAKGDIPDTITEEYKGDFNLIKNNLNMLIDAMNEITKLAEEMAEGDLTVTVNERSAEDRLMQALNTMSQRLSEVVTNVKSAGDYVASGSQAMSSSSSQMSQGATEQAAAAEEASSSMEQMVANIRQNSDNALQTEKIAVKAAVDAREGGTAVAQTVAAMQDIVKKVSIIEEIARQTHMLSLNATIEAAKAQEYGKGFGVVASEVRALAERAQSAAVEINAVANDSIAVAEKAGEMLKKLVPDIQKTAELVQEISAASNEQNTGAGQINRAIQQLDSVIQQNASSSEEMAATAEELASQAEQLQNTITFFKIAETTSWKPLTHVEQGMRVVHPQPVTRAGTLAQGENVSGNLEKNKGNGRDSSSAGYMVNIRQKEQEKDDLDDEFERY